MFKHLFLALVLVLCSPSFGSTLNITQGDTPTFQFSATNGAGVAIDLTGAVFTTQIISTNGAMASFTNTKHTADPDQTTNKGKFTLALSSADTALLQAAPDHEIVTKVVQGSVVTYFRGPKILTVLKPIPRQ